MFYKKQKTNLISSMYQTLYLFIFFLLLLYINVMSQNLVLFNGFLKKQPASIKKENKNKIKYL